MKRLMAAAALGILGVACDPVPPPAPVVAPIVDVYSCAINEEQIEHVIVPREDGNYRVHWYDPPLGPNVTQWQQMKAGVGYRAVGFGRGQVEYTAELDEVEVIHAIGGYWTWGWYPSCATKAGAT